MTSPRNRKSTIINNHRSNRTTLKISSSSSSSLQSSQHHHHHHHHHNDHCDGRPTIPTHRRACNFYIWNVFSALLYQWCHYLLKSHVYEGRGGYLFVSYESNSILQLLYPCTRYQPNVCALCGGTFPDHLELWWSQQHNLYSPLDQYLDKTYQDAIRVVSSGSNNDNNRHHHHTSSKNNNMRKQQQVAAAAAATTVVQRRRHSLTSSSSSTTTTTTTTKGSVGMVVTNHPPTFAFHKRYVVDISDIVNGNETDPKVLSTLVVNRVNNIEERSRSRNNSRNSRNNSRNNNTNHHPSRMYDTNNTHNKKRGRKQTTDPDDSCYRLGLVLKADVTYIIRQKKGDNNIRMMLDQPNNNHHGCWKDHIQNHLWWVVQGRMNELIRLQHLENKQWQQPKKSRRHHRLVANPQ